MKRRTFLIVLYPVLGVSLIFLLYLLIFVDNRNLNLAENQLTSYLDRINFERRIENESLYNSLRFSAGWAIKTAPNERDFSSLNDLFIPLVSNTSQLSAISLVWSTGEHYFIRHESPHFESYFSENADMESGQIVVWPGGKHIGLEADTIIHYSIQSEAGFSDRWSQKPDSIIKYSIMSIPGISYFPGLSYSMRTTTDEGSELLLTGYKSLQRVANFMNSIQLSETIEIHLFTAGGEYFNYTDLETEGFLVPWEESRGSSFYKAISQWANEMPRDRNSFLAFDHDDTKYFAAFAPNLESVNDIWTALIMPEKDFGFFFSGRLKLLLILLTSLIAGLQIFLIFMVGKNRMPRINKLADSSELLNLIRTGESAKLEFKSTLRLNLHTQKMGKEIELAWLKSVVAFCNTDGGSILIGVNDEGEILGTEADRFPNDDKALLHVQNLIKQHVGMEFAQYINYFFREVDGKKILVIQCQFCKEPVFLSNGDREQFYVRSGPASIELPVSKALQFIKDKKR